MEFNINCLELHRHAACAKEFRDRAVLAGLDVCPAVRLIARKDAGKPFGNRPALKLEVSSPVVSFAQVVTHESLAVESDGELYIPADALEAATLPPGPDALAAVRWCEPAARSADDNGDIYINVAEVGGSNVQWSMAPVVPYTGDHAAVGRSAYGLVRRVPWMPFLAALQHVTPCAPGRDDGERSRAIPMSLRSAVFVFPVPGMESKTSDMNIMATDAIVLGSEWIPSIAVRPNDVEAQVAAPAVALRVVAQAIDDIALATLDVPEHIEICLDKNLKSIYVEHGPARFGIAAGNLADWPIEAARSILHHPWESGKFRFRRSLLIRAVDRLVRCGAATAVLSCDGKIKGPEHGKTARFVISGEVDPETDKRQRIKTSVCFEEGDLPRRFAPFNVRVSARLLLEAIEAIRDKVIDLSIPDDGKMPVRVCGAKLIRCIMQKVMTDGDKAQDCPTPAAAHPTA